MTSISFYGDGNRWLWSTLHEFFAGPALTGPPTELCNLMTAEGSDKGGSWHNYTRLYHHLFQNRRETVRTVFELGIAEGNSLRAWKTYFPNALVYGADINPKTIFSDDRISTFLVDQTSPSDTVTLWNNFPDGFFDLMIDDGAHGFEANTTFFQRSLAKLIPDGLYIIEDIAINPEVIAQYHAFFSATPVTGAIVPIPHPGNTYDNCLGIFRGNSA